MALALNCTGDETFEFGSGEVTVMPLTVTPPEEVDVVVVGVEVVVVGVDVVVVEVVDVEPTVIVSFAVYIWPLLSQELITTLCVPPPRLTLVLMFAVYVRYFSLPSTYRIIDAIGELVADFALATKFTGLPTVAPAVGALMVTPVAPLELEVEEVDVDVDVEVEVLVDPTVKFTVCE